MSMGSYLAIVKGGVKGLILCRMASDGKKEAISALPEVARTGHRGAEMAREWRESGCLDGYWTDINRT